jgi:hypothetical protein
MDQPHRAVVHLCIDHRRDPNKDLPQPLNACVAAGFRLASYAALL